MDISGFDKLLQESLGVSQRKQQELEETSQRMQNQFNPLNFDNVEHVDGDTFRLKDRPEVSFRVQNDPSYGVDTFESDASIYEQNPERLKAHRRNYAKLTGRPEWAITVNELVDRGKVQSEQTRARMAELGQQGKLGYKVNGIDNYGRQLIQLYNTETGENFYGNHSGREQNASYDSKFNAGQQLEDIFSGERGRYDAFQGGRGVKGTAKDLGVSLLTGTGRMATGLAQGALTLIGGNGPVVDRFFSAVNEGLDNFQNSALSNEALARNARIDRNRARNVEAFDTRKTEYIRQGFSETEAKLFAGAEEFQDTIGDLLLEPGYIVDKTVESLPYMIGVASAGRAAISGATKLLSKNTLRQVVKAGGTSEQAAASVARYLKSEGAQKILSRVTSATGVGTVGVTEALTNSSDVYNSVANMSEEEASKSDQYRALRAEGMSHKDATRALAEAAFESTFLPGMLIAAAASAITGAGGWEARLFTRQGGESLVSRVTKEGAARAAAQGATEGAKGGIIRRGVAGTVRNVGRFSRFAGPASLSEATEETIQSGSQEFLSQLAQFNAGLGPEPGAGIGAAAGEGAAIGFVSGAGFQSISGGLKKLADADIRKSGLDRIRRTNATITPIDRSGTPGGTVAAAQESTQNVTPEQAAQTISELREQYNKDDLNTLNEMVQRKAQIEQLAAKAREKGELSTEDQKFLDTLQGDYVESLDRAAAAIQQREKTTEYTQEEKAILQQAIANDTPAVREMAQNNEELNRIYSHTRRVFTAIDEQEERSLQAAGASSEIDSKNSLKVAREKMGDGYAVINGQRRPGLKAHFRLISEAIAAGDAEQVKERSQSFLNFVNSQRQKLKRLEKLLTKKDLKDGDKLHEFTYKKGATEAYYDTLYEEFETMKATRDSLAALSQGWNGEAKAIPQVPNTPKRTFEPVEDTGEPAPARERTPRTFEAVDEGATNEEPTQQGSAEDNVGQPSSDSESGTAAETQPETNPAVESEPEAAPRAAENQTTESESDTGDTTESAATDVELETLKVPELQALARANNIPLSENGRKLRRQELIDRIRNETMDEASQQEVEQSAREQEQAEAAEESNRTGGATEESAPEAAADGQREPAPKSAASAIFTDGDFQAALTAIAETSKNKLYRPLAARLAEVLAGRKIEIVTLNDNEYEAYMRAYAPGLEDTTAAWLGERQQVVMRNKYRNHENMEQAFLHEMTHAAINGWMTKPKNSPTEKALHNRAQKLRKQVIEAIKKLAQQNPSDARYSEVLRRFEENQEEWITYAWSNLQAQEVLKEIQISQTLTAWQGIMRIIKGILGLEGRTGLDHVLAVSDRIFETNKGQRGRSAREGSTYTPSPEAIEAARKAQEEADGGVVEQAEAQPERSSETEPEAPTADEIALNDRRWDALRDIKRMQRALEEGKVQEDEVAFLDKSLEALYQSRLQGNTVAGALAQLEQYINERLNRNIKRTQVSTAELKLPEIIRLAKEIRSEGTTTAANKVITAAQGFDTEGGFARIQRWLGGKFDTANIEAYIRTKLAALGLPVSVDKGFRQASKTAKSLITAVPNLHQVLENPEARRQLYDALELTPAEEKAFETFRQFRNEFAVSLSQAYEKLEGEKIQWPQGNRIEDNPAYLLTGNDELLDPAVVTALAYEAMNWLAGDGQSLSNDTSAIIDILGLPENSTLTAAQKRLTTAGTLRRHVVETLGRNAYRHLNIAARQSPDISPNLDERMEQALGTIAVRALILSNRVEAIGFEGAEFAAMKGEEQTEHENYNRPVNFIRIMSYGPSGNDRFYHSTENADLIDDSRPGRTVFTRLFGVSGVVKEPLLTEPTEDHVPKKALRSLMVLSKKLREAIRSQQARAWTTDSKMIETLRRFDSLEDFLAAGHEFEQNMNRVHALDKDAIAARNRGLMSSIENAFKWYDENGVADFFLTYFVSKTGRTHVGSTFINPQSSKIHRFLFRQKGWTKTVPLNGKDKRLLNNFKIAVALGMDFKIEGKGVDKLTQDAILSKFDDYMDSKPVQDALEILARDGSISLQGEANAPLRDLLSKEGTHTLAALLAWQEYQDAVAAGATSFVTSMPMEVDGVTNGFAAGLLQTPPIDPKMLERAKDLSRATGMFYDDDTVRSFAQWLQDPTNKDNYQAAALLMAENLKKAMDRNPEIANIVAEALGPDVVMLMDPKKGRDFAKNPLMIIAYGAGFASVRRNMINGLITEMYNNLAQTTELPADQQMNAVLNILNRAVRTMNAGQRITFERMNRRLEDWQVKKEYTADDIQRMINSKAIKDKQTGEPITDVFGFAQNFEFGQFYDKDKFVKYDMSNLSTALDAAYGSSLQDSLSTMLNGIREIRDSYNHAVMLMNAIFKVEFNRRVSLMERESGRVIGRRQRSQILTQMHKEGLVPSIRTAYSQSLDENLELTAYEYELLNDQQVKVFHPRKGNVRRRWYSQANPEGEVQGDTGSTTSRLTARNPSMDVGVAGVVGTIHSLDGTNSADVFGQFGVLNVFDAWVMSIDDMEAVPQTGNRRFAQQAKEYDLGQELLRSVRRMTLLMEPGEGRFNEAMRREAEDILYAAMDEAKQIDRSEDSQMPDTPGGLYQYILDVLESTVRQVTESRDSLLRSLILSNQFSHDGAAYEVPAEERETLVPIIGNPEDYVRDLQAAQKINAKAATLANNLSEDGNFQKAVFNWLQEEAVRPVEALRVIAQTFEYAGLAGASTVTDLLAMLAPHLGDVKIIKVGNIAGPDLGQYDSGNREITLDAKKFTEQDNPLETLLHEILHAATDQALFELSQNNPDLLKTLNARATEAMTKLKAKKNRTAREDDMMHVLAFQEDVVLRVGEYLAWTLTSVEIAETGELSLLFNNTPLITQAMNSMGQTLTQGNTRNPIIRSSQDHVNNKLFENVDEELLESDKLHLNMQQMEELDNAVDPAEATTYKNFISYVMDGILLPGLAALQNPTFLQVAVETDGTKNLGEVERGSDKNVLRVQVARGKLSNNGGMTNQEVFAHELYHAVTGYTIESDTKVRAELRKIYEYARDRLTWEDFMPAEEDIAGDRSAVEQAAKDRYDYIFGQVQFDQNGEPLWDQLQEFAAIGLSNKPLALALSRIDAPSAAEPLWDGNILSFLVNLISRGLELLRGETLGTRRAQNSADALFKLSQRIVTINKQAQVRKAQKSHDSLWRNSFDQKVADRIIDALDRAQARLRLTEEEKKQAGSIKKYLRMGTHAALAQRTEAQQKANREFMRHLGVNKHSALSEIISEVLPYNKDDRGNGEKVGFLDLLRHSKVMIDIARQRAIEHTRSYLLSTFDKKDKRTRAERLAMTNVVLRTDLSSLMRHNPERTYRDIHQMLKNEALVDAEIARLERALDSKAAELNVTKAVPMYKRQINSLANYMTRGVMTERNGMKNAHNIVRQYNLWLAADRVPLTELDARELDPIVDQLATLQALKLTRRSDLDKALRVIDHEMARNDDNGFFNILGMAENYYQSSKQDLFDNNPVQMRKGYVYDVTDGDINMEVIMDTPDERRRMEELGMVRIGRVNEDKHDGSAPWPRAMYKGYRGANTWQKAVVSITSEQRQGASLFEVSGYDPKAAAYNLGQMLKKNHADAKKQFGLTGAPQRDETLAIPVLNEAGVIIDYTYEMSLNAKQTHLKNARNNDYFDQVIPRMFGAIPDRVGTKKMNRQTAQLIFDEWEAFKDSPEHNLVDISRYGNKRSQDMFNVIPGEMKKELAALFRGTRFVDQKGRLIALPLRDEAVNLVLGFRKLSILDLEVGGQKVIRGQKPTFVAKTAEKVWQEIMQLVRIKMAIINPTVVAGNLSSNFGILLAEGIPAKYIQAKTSEAIRSMRQYQRDITRVDKLQREIGVLRANGRPVARLIQERERLKAELRKNPVGRLVEEGLFTSIVEDVTSEEDTYREWLVGSAIDKLKGPLPGRVVALAKEAYMVPGSNAFNMAIAATQYGDFIGRYVKFKYETEVKKINEHDAINNALASFIYYDMPQNRWLQFMNDNGFMMFTKFFLRIQPVIARLFQENPVKATGVLAMQQALMSPFDENIGTFALFNGIDNRYHPFPLAHLEKLEPTHPSLFQWLWPFGL